MASDLNLEELKAHKAILRVYESRVPLRKENGEMVGLCPFHPDKNPSLHVSEHDGTWIYLCFGCGEKGNVFQFLQALDKITFKQAVKKVQDFIGGSWETQKSAVEKTFRTISEKPAGKTYPISEYSPVETALEKSSEAQKFLKSRGINYDTARKLHFGFRPSVGKLSGEDNADIADRGWIVFPSIRDGIVTGIKYRSIVRKVFCRQPGMGSDLFNWNGIDDLEPVYVVEGELDVATLVQAGFRSVSLPSASSKISPEWKDRFLEADHVLLSGDSDPVGQQAMTKVWSEMRERTFLLKWPDGLKDANEVFLKKCKGDLSVFRTMVEELTMQARSVVAPGIYSLPEAMESSDQGNLLNNPKRMRFPWPSVDKMITLLPGGVLSVFATQTGMGKTTWVMNIEIDEARSGETVLNYSAELSPDEYANIVAAYLLSKNRTELTKEDMKKAAAMLRGVQFYLGYNPDLDTVDAVLDLIEAAVRRLGATRVVIDHIHFICLNEKDPIGAQANAMQRIKNMAAKYGVIFIVVGQPRKANQQSKGKLVHITDAKGSEAFTSSANAVIALHRNEALILDPNNPPKEPYEPKTQVHLKKGRSLGTGNAFSVLQFIGEYAKFQEIAYEPMPSLPPAKVDRNLYE